MEKQVDDNGGVSAAVYEEGHSGDHKEDKHHNKEHKDEVVHSEDREKSTPRETHDDGKKGAGHQSPVNPSLHEKHGSNDKDVTHGHNDKMDTHVKHTHDKEDAGMMHEPGGTSATHGKPEHNVEHAHEPLMQGKISHNNEVAAGTHEHMEKSAIHDDEHVGLAHESGERHKIHKEHADDVQDSESLRETAERPMTHEKLTHVDPDMDSTSKSKENLTMQRKHMHDDEAGHASYASKEHSPVDGEHRSDVEDMNMYHTPRDKSPRHEKHVPDGDDECESKKAFSDENSSRDRVHFSRGSTPDVDTPTQCASSPFSNTNPSKAGSKGVGNAERGPGSVDGNPETPPSTSWAFSARASIAPSKFDHMATLRITYAAYKESNRGKEGVPLSLT